MCLVCYLYTVQKLRTSSNGNYDRVRLLPGEDFLHLAVTLVDQRSMTLPHHLVIEGVHVHRLAQRHGALFKRDTKYTCNVLQLFAV